MNTDDYSMCPECNYPFATYLYVNNSDLMLCTNCFNKSLLAS
jgi:hypothetical protein